MVIRTNILAAVAVAAVGSVPALAQTEAPTQAGPQPATWGETGDAVANSSEDIVVTARRVSEKLQDVPLAISAVTGDGLQRQGVKELRDLNA
ncbi:MAG: TonB-dependent receptor, partial [Sphingobium sp.]